jgi:inositol phosphorylceramide mannosyltransferase catalytic subunit
MKIPSILHQTWKDSNVPEEFDQLALSWRNKHAHWNYLFWTDEMNRNFIKEHFSFFLTRYDNYQTNIERVDAVRYFVMYKYGGFYIDMDFECLANIEPVVNDAVCVFGKEPVEHCNWHSKDFIISNAFMGAMPGFHFFDLLCAELQQCRPLTDHPNTRVLESTGPFMLSRMYMDYEKKEEISILDADLLYPLTQDELSDQKRGLQKETIQAKLQKAYGIHHYAGTWWKK